MESEEPNPNLALYQKEALLNPHPEEGPAKLRAVLEITETGQSEREKRPIPNINAGAPFLRGVIGNEISPENQNPALENRLPPRKGFEPEVVNIIEPEPEPINTEPIILSPEEKLFFDPSLMKHEAKGEDSVLEILS